MIKILQHYNDRFAARTNITVVSFNLLGQNTFSQGEDRMPMHGDVMPCVAFMAPHLCNMYLTGFLNPQFPLVLQSSKHKWVHVQQNRAMLQLIASNIAWVCSMTPALPALMELTQSVHVVCIPNDGTVIVNLHL